MKCWRKRWRYWKVEIVEWQMYVVSCLLFVVGQYHQLNTKFSWEWLSSHENYDPNAIIV